MLSTENKAFATRAALTVMLYLLFCVFTAEGTAYAAGSVYEQSDLSNEDSSGATLFGWILVIFFLVAPVISIYVYKFRYDSQMRYQLTPEWDLEEEGMFNIRPNCATWEIFRWIPWIFGAGFFFTLMGAVFVLDADGGVFFLIVIPTYIIAGSAVSMWLLIKSSFVRIYDDGDIYYHNHMRIRPKEFSVSDIDYIKDRLFNRYALYLKSGKRLSLFWLMSPPEFREYLIEQGIPTKDKG